MSSLGSVGLPESDSFMQGDGADGSGSGAGPDFSDDDDDMRGSGSGDGPHVQGKPNIRYVSIYFKYRIYQHVLMCASSSHCRRSGEAQGEPGSKRRTQSQLPFQPGNGKDQWFLRGAHESGASPSHICLVQVLPCVS